MPDPAVPVAAPDVVERLQRQLTIPLSIMGGESYVLDTDDVREATAVITRLRARVAELEAERAGVDDFRLMLAKLVHRLRQRPDLPAKEMIEQAADLLARKGGASILRSTPDPRDARIAELEAALRVILCDCPSCQKHRAVKAAVEQERARTVAWLRAREEDANAKLDEGGAYPDWYEHERDVYWSVAEAIQRGDHA